MKPIHKLSFWKVNPLVRPALFFLAGIKVAECVAYDRADLSIIVVFSLILCSYALTKFCRAHQFNAQRLSAAFLLISIFFSGIFISQVSNSFDDKSFFSSELLDQDLLLKVKISSHPRFSKKGIVKFDADLISVCHNSTWLATSAKLKCNSFQKDDLKFIKAGDYYILQTKISIPPLAEPNADFDYRSWLVSNGYSGIINFTSKRLFLASDLLYPKRLSGDLQKDLLGYIYDSEFSEKNKQLAGALLLGDKLNLDDDLKESFSSSGIIHLLAVSGLHVGLIYQLLSFILAVLLISRNNKLIAFFITIIVLWGYAFITGLSPSVCRAATMLSITSLAILLKSHKQPFNTLFGTAIILICLNPLMINDIGFWLSFLAVYGILSISPYSQIINRIEIKPVKWVLLSLLISTSAQIATAPLSLYIFGKFPTFFMISNLFAIPLASIITFTGFLALSLQFIPYLGEIFLTVCMICIEFLIKLSDLISNIPHSTILFNDFSLQNALILLLIVFFLLNLHQMNSLVQLRFILISILGFSLLVGFSERTRFTSSSMTYATLKNKQTRFIYYSGSDKIWETQIKTRNWENTLNDQKLILVNQNKGFFILKDGMKVIAPPTSCKWMIHVQSSNIEYIDQWINMLRPMIISIDASLSFSEQMKLQQYCTLKGLAIWNWEICNALKIS